MEVRYTTTEADWAAMFKHLIRRNDVARKTWKRQFVPTLVVVALVAAGFGSVVWLTLHAMHGNETRARLFGLGTAVAVLLSTARQMTPRGVLERLDANAERSIRKRTVPVHLSTLRVEATDDGLVETDEDTGSVGCSPWSSVAGVLDDGEYVFIDLAAGGLLAPPKRAFPDADSRSSFVQLVRSHASTRDQ